MPRYYRHIEEYEAEILCLKSEGKTRKEIGDALGFSPEHLHRTVFGLPPKNIGNDVWLQVRSGIKTAHII